MLTDLTFPLVPRRRVLGLAFGAAASVRRGTGSDVAGSRPYHPADGVATIDWNASAKASSARGSDEFIVRERYAEEAPVVVIVADRRPAMAVFPDDLPWLSKPRAVRVAAGTIAASAIRARAPVATLDESGVLHFVRPSEFALADEAGDAAEESLASALHELTQARRRLPPGTFVFVLSDFLAAPSEEAWLRAQALGWDVVPVVVQDPVWEQSFPLLPAVAVPIVDAASGRRELLRLRPGEARARREANRRRLQELLDGFLVLGLDPVLLGSSEPAAVLGAFLGWAEQRSFTRGRQWRLGA